VIYLRDHRTAIWNLFVKHHAALYIAVKKGFIERREMTNPRQRGYELEPKITNLVMGTGYVL